MNIEKIYFKTEDKLELFGLLHKPMNDTNEVVISVHGMGSNCLKKRESIFADEAAKAGKAYFSFNNRGTEYMVKFNKNNDRLIAGTAYEEILDSHYDISGAINVMKELGYKKINLLGHSLGSTKIVYWYNKVNMNNEYNISSINLLSLVDIIDCQKEFLKDEFDSMLEYALKMEKQCKQNELMPEKAFFNPISVKSYLRYFKYNSEIDFAKYSEKEYDFDKLNNIKIPLFMRWGNVRELIVQSVDEVVEIVKNKVKNSNLDVGYIKDADHSYSNKEKEVIKQVLNFIDCKKISIE